MQAEECSIPEKSPRARPRLPCLRCGWKTRRRLHVRRGKQVRRKIVCPACVREFDMAVEGRKAIRFTDNGFFWFLVWLERAQQEFRAWKRIPAGFAIPRQMGVVAVVVFEKRRVE